MNAIEVMLLAKKYKISPLKKDFPVKNLKDDLARLGSIPLNLITAKILGKIKKKLIHKKIRRSHWALKNVSFSIEKGEIVGIIGKNGSGKSTLLKIMAGITPPSDGEVRIEGKLASLLSVGVGFHSDLSGRENIYLNGAILGFKKSTIDAEIDKIIKFSGIGKYIDTPVKFYSSGMYVRLAFSIATSSCMKPDIFLVDEVLSVGDAEFQEKSFKRMVNLIEENNSTILIVSHNEETMKRLCHKCIWLNNGRLKMFGPTQEVLESYNKFLITS